VRIVTVWQTDVTMTNKILHYMLYVDCKKTNWPFSWIEF